MMVESWLTFVFMVIVFALLPGPTVILVVGQVIANGRKSVMPLVTGVLSGDFVAMTLSLAGLGAILATSATLFSMLKWIGVGYLIYLGIRAWQTPLEADFVALNHSPTSRAKLFKSAFLVTAFNPKDIVFFVVFLPQFVNPKADPLPQLLILMLSFLSIIAITISVYAVFAGVVSHKLQGYRARQQLNKLSGGALIGAGLLASAVQRS